ncbi:MAG: polyprenyl synthetase family protein [Clostridia bacterium]|nr:polyprenyl synthetase family protein [Clostridia bacterium]
MTENWMNEYKALVDREIDCLVPTLNNCAYAFVNDAARYSLTLGGKRIRPIIMLECCRLFGGDIKQALGFAVALEMIHTYSLIHDDLPCMDNDDMRRGKPSCHIKFGEDTALLAGDTLLTEAFNIAANSSVDDKRKIKAIAILAKRAGLHGMIGGQVLDLSFEKTKPTMEQLKEMCCLKTGCLISAAAEIGAVIAGATENQVALISEYAFNLGLAFQIIDDILDVTSTAEVLGKPINSDAENDKATFVTLLGLDNAKALASDLTKQALDILSSLNKDTKRLCSLTNMLLQRNY